MHYTSINDGCILGIRFKQKKTYRLCYEYYLEHPMNTELTIVCNGYLIPKKDIWKNRLAKSSAKCFSSIEIQLQSVSQETEAGMGIIPHLYRALNFECDTFFVLTSDTDMLILLLRYCAMFLTMKSKNLYIKI